MTPLTDTPLHVVAAVIERRGRYLLAQRPADKAHAGLWEFPGGKVDAGESLACALARELEEELVLRDALVGEVLAVQRDQTRNLHLHFMAVQTEGAPIAVEHSALGWYLPAEAHGLALAPLDKAFLVAFGFDTFGP